MNRQPKVTVKEVKPSVEGNRRAFATVEIGPCTFRKCPYVREEGKSGYVGAPQARSVVDGKPRYLALVSWPSEWTEAITREVVAYIQANGMDL